MNPIPANRFQAAARSIAPLRMLVAAIAIFLGGLLVAPIVAHVPASFEAIFYLGTMTLAAMVGLALSHGPRGISPKKLIQPMNLRPLVRWVLVLGASGTLLLIVDRYLVRGVPFGVDIFTARDAIEDSQAGLLSSIAAGLAAFSLFGPSLVRIAAALGQPCSTRIKMVAWGSVLLYILASVLLGSRTLFLVFVLLTVLTRAYARALEGPSARARSKYWIYLFALLILVFFSNALMLVRLQQMGLDPMTSIRLSGYATTVNASPWLIDLMNAHPGTAPLAAASLSLVLYIYHGLFEFFLLFSQYRSPHTMGAIMGWLPLKVVGVLSGTNLQVNLDSLSGVRSGIFTTFVGPAFIDFGWWAVPIVGLLFTGLGLPMRLLRAGKVQWFPWIGIVAVICILYPVLNLLESAMGTYPLVAAGLIPLLATIVKPGRRNCPEERV